MPETRDQPPSSRRLRVLAVALVALGLAVRLTLALMVGERQAARAPDSTVYLDLGKAVAEGRGLDVTATPSDPAAAAPKMPGYPALLALGERLFDEPVRAVLVFQALCGAAAMAVAAWIASRLAGPWAGPVALALLVFDPYQVYFAALVTPVVPTGLAVAILAAAGVKILDRAENVRAASVSSRLSVAEQKAPRLRVDAWPLLMILAWVAAVCLEFWAILLLPVGLAIAVAASDKRRLLVPWLTVVSFAGVVVCMLLLLLLVPHRQWALLTPPSADSLLAALRLWAPASVMGENSTALPAVAGYTSMVPVILLALAGVWGLRRRLSAVAWLLALAVALTLAALVMPVPPYARLAVIPLLAALGGVGLATLLRGGGSGDPPRDARPEPRT